MDSLLSERLLDKYRHINVEHDDWWDAVYECFKDHMSEVGICVDKIYFSMFWSQGDGACFEGDVSDLRLYLDKHLVIANELDEEGDD